MQIPRTLNVLSRKGKNLAPAKEGLLELFAICLLLFSTAEGLASDSLGLHILDLTKKSSTQSKSLGIPGIQIGNIPGHGTTPVPYLLPFDLKVKSVKPTHLDLKQTFIVEIILRNTGSTTFYLPASTNSTQVFARGNKGKREITFSLHFFTPNGEELNRSVMAVTYGSETSPPSLLRLDPNESVLVRFKGDFQGISQWISAGNKDVRAQVVFREWTYEDDRYFVKSFSEEVKSQDRVTLLIVP